MRCFQPPKLPLPTPLYGNYFGIFEFQPTYLKKGYDKEFLVWHLNWKKNILHILSFLNKTRILFYMPVPEKCIVICVLFLKQKGSV